MRFTFTANSKFLQDLNTLQATQLDEMGRVYSKKEIIIQAVDMLISIDELIEEGYSFCIVDPEGESHFLRRSKDDGQQDVSEGPEDS